MFAQETELGSTGLTLTLSPVHSEALVARGLDPEHATLRCGLHTSKAGLLAVPYVRNGKLCYRKLRERLEPGKPKGRIVAEPADVPHFLWNIDCLLEKPLAGEPAIITAGEFDAIALLEQGYRFVMSLPDGDSSAGAVAEVRSELLEFDRIVLALDSDAAGLKALDAISDILGAWVVEVPTWPVGCKDANDVLIQKGAQALTELIETARPAHAAEVGSFADLPDAKPIRTYRCGIPALEKHIHWTFPEFCVTVGPYGSGKSTFAKILAYNFIASNSQEVVGNLGITAFEESYVNRLKRDFVRMMIGDTPLAQVSAEDRRAVDQMLARIYRIEPMRGRVRNVGWWIDRMRYARRRHSCRYFLLDPWNRMDHILERGETETQYASEMLSTISDFTVEENVIVHVVAHTSKGIYERGKIREFRLADAHGTSHFGNRADRGFCVWRQTENGRDNLMVKCDKIKEEGAMGELGKIAFTLDRRRMRLLVDDITTAASNDQAVAVGDF